MDNAALHKEEHEFALYVKSLSLLVQKKNPHDHIILSDDTLFHRIVTVLRLSIGDTCILFDQKIYVKASIANFTGKKHVTTTILLIEQTVILRPYITFLLPLLKRDDLEAALYTLTEVGVNTIQLISTSKAHQLSWQRDSDRIQRIIISAAEQSKNFAYPNVKAPIALEIALQEYHDVATKIFFDPQGKKLFNIMHLLHNTQSKDILLLIGPEGDLTREEKKIIQTNNFIFCALTPTILRAKQAAALSAGFIRSLTS
jgi:16S rRNA (uracil1498-N3)-methyltransferase